MIPFKSLLNEIEFRMMCLTAIPSPPSLNPFPSPLPVLSILRPLLYAIQLSMITAPIGPVSILAYKSHPSSTLWCATQFRKTFPSPLVSFEANPSALFCAGSAFPNDSQP